MSAAHADDQQVLNEGFDNVPALNGWTQVNHSVPAGTGWFQGVPDVFASQAGAPNAYIGANYLGALNGMGSVDNWLITPTLDLGGTTTLSFFTSHAGDPGFMDKLEVRFAPGTGGGTDDFSTLLLTIGAADYPTAWQQFSASVNVDGPGRFAFRYLGDAANLNFIGIDSVSVVTAVPEPSLYLMLTFGLGLLATARRKFAQ
ncbi:PEP-CTERM sorting domain-containing protein [Massilia horti]|uniref:PEP-CTERM sorting domain-containing protein n=2 Tax=Massilia horti TaxID=2562153 RepID=A0A4Y9SN14_9BURK|nr:PEP-CTERM sorting domain-containing protein [Massilia horti]